MSADNKKACIHLMKNKLTELMACPLTSVVKANLHINKMMYILCNIGAQHGEQFGKQKTHGKVF